MACGSGCCGAPNTATAAPPPSETEAAARPNFSSGGSEANRDTPTSDGIAGPVSSESTSSLPKDDCCRPNTTFCQSGESASQFPPTEQYSCSKNSCSASKDPVLKAPDANPKADLHDSLGKACKKFCCSGKSVPDFQVSATRLASGCAKQCCSKDETPLGTSSTMTKETEGAKSGCCSRSKTCTTAGNDNGAQSKSLAPHSGEASITNKDESNDLSTLGCRPGEGTSGPVSTGCRKDCCSQAKLETPILSEAPACCVTKSSPCCDDSCIERLALRECASDSTPGRSSLDTDVTNESSTAPLQCHHGIDGKPCVGHTRTTRNRYQKILGSVGCICRTLIAGGQKSCCTPPSVLSSNQTPVLKVASRTSNDSARSLGSCADSCCGVDASVGAADAIEVMPNGECNIDLEKGTHETEHVIVSISGLTCTGCETKLRRTLGTLPAIRNLKTSLILARAEFDLVYGLSSPDDVIKHLERTTEFKCERVSNEGSSLELICPLDSKEFIKEHWPDGVTDIKLVDKRTVRVHYDAESVGARDLVEKGWPTPMHLAPTRPDATLDAGNKHVRRMGFMTILSAILTVPVLVMAWAPLPEDEIAYGSASLALATVVQVTIAGPFYPKALKDLIFSRTVEMDLLIVLSTSAAYIFSVVSFSYMAAGKPLSTGDFFETATLLVTIIMIGRYISALARQKAAESVSIRSLQTATAILVDDEKGGETEIDARLLQYGDTFRVHPESMIPTDGTVSSGTSEVNESMMTGESIPVVKPPKSTVIAGSINGSGTLTVRLTRLPGHNTISTIAGMVDEAKLSKPKIQDIADRVASYFVPVVVTLTIATFVIWVVIGKTVRKQSGSDATVQALTYAITVLIVSCPCAIGLAVPMVVVIACGVAAQRGVIFKTASSIEVAYKTSDVVFDKTGTLTQGELATAHEAYFTEDVQEARSLLLGLIGTIKHPVSAAIASHLKVANVAVAGVQDCKSLPGRGVEGAISGRILRAGNSHWLGCHSRDCVQAVLAKGLTAFCFMVDDELVAVYGLNDSLRPEAHSTVASLQDAGITVHILSGDDDGAVRSVAAQLDIPDTNIRSQYSPSDKLAYIKILQQPSPTLKSSQKRKHPTVVFVGDGTNDAPSLAQATIGVHISTGTDVAQSAADVVFIRPNLSGVLTMIAVSKKAIHRIAFNFAWSFVYNVFAVLLGAGAFVAAGENARIPPEFAGLGELVSVLPVIAAAVALRWAKV